MKILFVHNKYQQPGGEDVVFEQEYQLLKAAGHDPVMYCRSNWEADHYTGIRRLELASRTIWARDSHEEFARRLRELKPDLVHVHNTFLMISPSIFSVCIEAGIPVVLTLHNYRLYCPAATFYRDGHVCEECVQHGLWRGVAHGCYRESRAATAVVSTMLAVHRWSRTWERGVNCFIALTEYARAKFVRCGLPAEKVFVKPNFVHPDPGRPPAGPGDYALFVGRLSPEKRVSTMLQAWEELKKLNIPLLILGGGPQLSQLAEECSRRGLRDVSFRGQTEHEQTLAMMHNARVLIFPSEWYENFPVTIAESFACGVPVICSRIGAMQEIVEDGHTGLHFTPGDPKSLAEKVEWAWKHPHQLATMGVEARREYEAKYTAATNYPLLMGIYERVLQGRRQVKTSPNAITAMPHLSTPLDAQSNTVNQSWHG